ncbi:uncharacterized protein I206_107788 [Kwoniella pini CBS 10737]|uniref:Uncharacterized protein n=1 Tax=Kwoniella pini CBS 10737 TaxID=1296096 RepID=A0A1B9HY95_9TREE|nr:uncharacterized protein I206_06121 [Kwoniella pini CBS 10737]OCF48253.1 hypothetical protein I206_06121 [Kwoniella pini CBS 10737]
MPIILASLVFAITLAALPSTEPQPDANEEAQYIADLKAERERSKRGTTKRGRDRFQSRELFNSTTHTNSNQESIFFERQERKRTENSDMGLGLGLDLDTSSQTISRSRPTRPRIISDIYSIPNNQFRHLRRSSSVPSLSTCSSTETSPTNSPGNSPRPCSTILM